MQLVTATICCGDVLGYEDIYYHQRLRNELGMEAQSREILSDGWHGTVVTQDRTAAVEMKTGNVCVACVHKQNADKCKATASKECNDGSDIAAARSRTEL